MTDSQSIIGFTEAELGFFLVLMFVLIWAISPAVADTGISADSAALLEKRAIILAAANDSARRRLKQLERAADSMRSTILPSCRSKAIVRGPLMYVTAVGAGRFILGRDTVPFGAIAEQTANARAVARSVGCVHQIRFAVAGNVLAAESERARAYLGGIGLRVVR